ncbi:MAG: hydroxymethylglutaryl-CoA lyase [candidate division NC10 bacterium]|nr:hydroxymethylglutaryl-CoA lyase [candidate division NC10 bacterium]
MSLPASVTIVEVGPRDGLQNLRQVLPTADKVRYIGLLAASGLTAIEVTSFVSPKAVPQLADAAETVAGIRDLPITPIALVANLKGARNAVAAGVRRLNFVLSVSTSHHRSNVNRTREESLAELAEIVDLAEKIPGFRVRASLATAFGCPFEGQVPIAEVLRWVGAVATLGITEVTLADTVGFGNPELVRQVLLACRDRFPGITCGVHFHDTRGLGIANALMGMQCGVTVLDAAAGGLGGCPFAPGATGNIATEDLIFLCEEMDVKTGVDLARLCEASRFLQSTLPGVDLPSRVFRAGPPKPRGPISE